MENTNTINTPIKIGTVEIKNRLVKSAIAESAADSNGYITERYYSLYKDWAGGGAGLLITGHIFVDVDGKASNNVPLLDKEDKIEQFARLTRLVHASSETKIFAQLNDAGREAVGNLRAPSRAKDRLTFCKAKRAMDPSDIESIITAFAKGSQFAKEAGFDGIQLHAAHGYLIHQFLSQRSNLRDDEYGGKDINNRMRFLERIYDACRERVGKGFPIIIKINGEDHIKGGHQINDTLYILRRLEDKGLDGVEISGGCMESGFYITRGAIPLELILQDISFIHKMIGKVVLKRMADKVTLIEGYNLSNAAKVKKALKIPVITVGGFRTKGFMFSVVDKGMVDMIAMARPFIRQPDLPHRILNEDTITVQCKSCNRCLFMRGEGVRCFWN